MYFQPNTHVCVSIWYGIVQKKHVKKNVKKKGLTTRHVWVEVLDVVIMVMISDWLFVTLLYGWYLLRVINACIHVYMHARRDIVDMVNVVKFKFLSI